MLFECGVGAAGEGVCASGTAGRSCWSLKETQGLLLFCVVAWMPTMTGNGGSCA